jgi:hypothetical protein
MSHGQIRTPVAIKLLNLFDLTAKIDVVAAPSPATIFFFSEVRATLLPPQDRVPAATMVNRI